MTCYSRSLRLACHTYSCEIRGLNRPGLWMMLISRIFTKVWYAVAFFDEAGVHALTPLSVSFGRVLYTFVTEARIGTLYS